MARIRPDQPLTTSLLDRLLDDEPEVQWEPPRNQNQTLRELKKSVRRDLENLLNTRVRCVPCPTALEQLGRSLVTYGIPDLTGSPFGSKQERDAFCATIRGVIAQYERRLKKLDVKPLDPIDSIERSIRFEIEAVLVAEPASERIRFDSALRLATGTFVVTGDGDG